MSVRERILEQLVVEPGLAPVLAERDPGWTGGPDYEGLSQEELKAEAKAVLAQGVEELSEAQELLWASDSYALLVVFQAMDAAGKDSAIEHVMSGVNPQGVQVVAFKTALLRGARPRLPLADLEGAPRARPHRHLQPLALRRGRRAPRPPGVARAPAAATGSAGEQFWEERYEDINAFERHLDRNGTKIVKFFLHVSKEEQKRRFLARLDEPDKDWKFNAADVAERARWDDYMAAYEAALAATSTPWAPWYVIPADHKRLTQALIARILVDTIHSLDLRWPQVSEQEHKDNLDARRLLEAEA